MIVKDQYAEWAPSYECGSITDIYETEKNFLNRIFDSF